MPEKYSLNVNGRRTSISLEKPFREAMKEVAAAEDLSLQQLAAKIDLQKGTANLSSAIRVYVLRHYQERCRQLEG